VRGDDGVVAPAPCFIGEGGVEGEASWTSSFEIR
jgi:hypothetical protein